MAPESNILQNWKVPLMVIQFVLSGVRDSVVTVMETAKLSQASTSFYIFQSTSAATALCVSLLISYT